MMLKRSKIFVKKCVGSSHRSYSTSIQSEILHFQNSAPEAKQRVIEACKQRAKENTNNSYINLIEENTSNNSQNPLSNVPYALKDAFSVKSTTVPTTMASKMLNNFHSSYDSAVYSILKECNALCIGKTNMDEFAMGSGTTYSVYGPSKNPINNEYITGGSSGGSAGAVAEGSALFAIGTDTGGSVRQPASYCGITGFKPSYGMISRYGMISFASSLDTVGIFAKHVYDTALVYDALTQGQNNIAYSNDQSVQSAHQNAHPIAPVLSSLQVANEVKSLKVAIPVEYLLEDLSPEIMETWQSAIDRLKEAGAEVSYVSLPHTKYALPAYYVIAPAEASSNLSRYDGLRYGYNHKKESPTDTYKADSLEIEDDYTLNRTHGFGEEVKRRILAGTFALSVDKYDTFFKRAQQTRTLVAEDFYQLLKFTDDHHSDDAARYDIILTPTAPSTAIKHSEFSKLTPVDIYTNDVFTIPASLAGLPAISIPFSESKLNGMPLGLQVIAGTELSVLKAAVIIEKLRE